MNLFRRLYYFFPPKWRIIIRKLLFFPSRIIAGKQFYNGIELPHKGMIFTGGGDFVATGEKFLSYFIEFGSLKDDDVILDIGSGMGRMAIPMTTFLKPPGEYFGLELMDQGVDWCKEHISKRFPHFHFVKANVKNDLYNLSGMEASKFQFPFEDDKFDFVLLISVFTHMLPHEIEHYLEEMNRCMNKGARALITFFIYSNENNLRENNFEKFYIQEKHYALMDTNVKSANVAFSYSYLQTIISKMGFNIKKYFEGSWKSGDPTSKDFQDILIIEKQ